MRLRAARELIGHSRMIAPARNGNDSEDTVVGYARAAVRGEARKAEASGGLYDGITAWLQENWLTGVHGGQTGVWCACDALVVTARPIL